MIDMLKALHYCHKVIKVIHRDIKPDNIMINHNNEAVLIDFGVSALVDNQVDDKLDGNNMGSYVFFAPEMFLRSKGAVIRGELTDIWALGSTFFYLLCGKFPTHKASNLLALKEAITTEEPDFSLIKNENARNIIKKMLMKNPDERATLYDVIKSDWITNKGSE